MEEKISLAKTKRDYQARMLIGGDWVKTDLHQNAHDVFTGEKISTIHLADETTLDRAMESARAAFEKTRRASNHQLTSIASNVAKIIGERAEELAYLIAREAGKPIKLARLEVSRAMTTFSLAGSSHDQARGEYLRLDLDRPGQGRAGIVGRFPIGPVAAITPFNFPLNLVAHKIAPALIAGVSVLLKPSPKTPMSAVALGEILIQAGMIEGQVNIVQTDNELAERLATDERIAALTFTGSDRVGWRLRSIAGSKRVALELGGDAAAIVLEDADIDSAVDKIVAGAFAYAGQICISTQRILIARSIYDSTVERIVGAMRKLTIARSIDDEKSIIGPMISSDATDNAVDLIDRALANGAELIAGGKRLDEKILTPTLLGRISENDRLAREEAFAPIAYLIAFDSVDEAIEIVNRSRYGLQAGLFTNRFDHALKFFGNLDIGAITLNEAPTYRSDMAPYGGVKESGLGREGIRYAIEELTERRALYWKNDSRP